MARASRRPEIKLPFTLPESGVVTVASKLPNGLVLQLSEMAEVSEMVSGGGSRYVSRSTKVGPQVVLNKARLPFGDMPEYKIIAGYALTENVDAQFFAEWCRQNADSDLIRNKIIFAWEGASQVEGMAREQAKVTSGLQPILQSGDPRMPKDIRLADKTNKDMQPGA